MGNRKVILLHLLNVGFIKQPGHHWNKRTSNLGIRIESYLVVIYSFIVKQTCCIQI